MSDPKIKYFYSSMLSNIIISVVVCFDNHNFMITKHVKGDDPDKKRYPGPPSLGFGVRLTAPSGGGGGEYCYEISKKRRPRPTQGYRANDDDEDNFMIS